MEFNCKSNLVEIEMWLHSFIAKVIEALNFNALKTATGSCYCKS